MRAEPEGGESGVTVGEQGEKVGIRRVPEMKYINRKIAEVEDGPFYQPGVRTPKWRTIWQELQPCH
jgi:hypothetical protein